MTTMLKKLWGFLTGLLGWDRKIPVEPAKIVESVELKTVDGKTFEIIHYSDGTTRTKEVEPNATDPTNVGDFMDSVNN